MSHPSLPHVVLTAQHERRIYVELHAGHSWKLNVSLNADAAGHPTPMLIATAVPSNPGLPAPAGCASGYIRIPFDAPVEAFLAGGAGWVVSVKMVHQHVDHGTGPREYCALLEARVVAPRHPGLMDAPASAVALHDPWARDSEDFDALLARLEVALKRAQARKSVAGSLLELNVAKAVRSLQLLVSSDNKPPSTTVTDYSQSEGAGTDDSESHPQRHDRGDADAHSV